MEHYSEGIEYDEKLVERLCDEFIRELEEYRGKVERLDEYERDRAAEKRAA